MAGTITYNDTDYDCRYIFRATSGGTVFSANLKSSTAFDLFDDTAVVNDAIYFGRDVYNSFSNLKFDIGTALAGTGITLVWEYYCASTATWRTMHDLTDNTVGFTVTGANTVVFPYQAKWGTYTLNGVAAVLWVRCRISALTTITEGGATQNSTVKLNYGVVYITGYTDASPCTWTIVYNWIVANAPQIGAYSWGTQMFKFDCCTFSIDSTLRSTNEKIFIGCGTNMSITLNYLYSGTKQGTNGWSNDSYLFLCLDGPSTAIGTTTNLRFYGGAINTFSNYVDGLTCSVGDGGYFGISSGEVIGTFIAKTGYFSTGTIDRCTIRGGLITASNVSHYPTNLQISYISSHLWTLYGNSLTVNDLNYTLPGIALCYMGAQYAAMGQTININNPSPAFPDQGIAVPFIAYRTLASTYSNLTSCKFYDASAGTYTNYLTEASSATVDDVPINGDIGDCLYLLCPGVSQQGNRPAITFTISDQPNDYVYAFEYYTSSGVWYEIPTSIYWDLTDNFTKTGIIYPAISNNWSQPTIDGTSGYWIRIRIVTKGTGTPMISKIKSRSQTGICDTKINENYATVLTIQDTNGNPIQGASVKFTNILGTLTTLTSDASGLTTSTLFTSSQTTFDKDTPETSYNYKKTSFNPYTLIVTKTGYETYYEKISITSKLTKTVTLKTSVPIMIDTDGELYQKLNPSNEGAFRDILMEK